MKKVLIVGEVFSTNLGDGIICGVVEKLFKNDYDVQILDLSGKQNYEKNLCITNFSIYKEVLKKVKHFIMDKLVNYKIINNSKHIQKVKNDLYELFINKYKKFKPDYIVFAGGQLFMDYFCEQINLIFEFAEKENVPVIFNACGIGAVSNKSRNILKRIINSKNTVYVSLRDGYEKMKELDMCNKVTKTYDTAILTNKFYSDSSCKKIKIGLGIMYVKNMSLKKQISFWSKILNFCEENNIEWEAFSNGSVDDQSFIEYLLNLNNISLDKAHKRPSCPEELISTITSYSKIISMRMHSLIIAYSYNIPFVGLVWDEKVRKFICSVGNDEACMTINDLPEQVFSVLEKQKIDLDKKEKIISSIFKNIDNIKKEMDNDKYDKK